MVHAAPLNLVTVGEGCGNLDGVQGGAFAQVIHRGPEDEAVRVAAVLADTADGDTVLPRDADRVRVEANRRIILHAQAGRLAEHAPRVVRAKEARELGVD